MASVTGITAERAQEIWDSSVVSGEVSETGHLLLHTRGGTVLDGGSLISPYVQKFWPVGSIFMSISSTNPSVSLGVGTWVAWGKGRVPVGVDGADPLFDAVEETGGQKEIVLGSNQLPAHVHSMAHTHSTVISYDSNLVESGTSVNRVSSVFNSTSGETDRNGSTGPSSAANTGSVGNGDPVNNLQPYITCYMWKRIA